MNKQAKTIDNIAAKFSIKTLPTIEGYPDYEGIKKLCNTILRHSDPSDTTRMRTLRAHRHHNEANAPQYPLKHRVVQPA